jgi:thiamine biosynthesis protein ThiC
MHHVAATRIANLIKDHMPVSQHEQIVEARLSALRSELTHEKNTAIAVAERDFRAETVRLEERKDQEYSMSMLNIRQGIQKLETQVEQVSSAVCCWFADIVRIFLFVGALVGEQLLQLC